jgi:hypothetical protein
MSFAPGTLTAMRQFCKLAKRVYRTSGGMKGKLKKTGKRRKEI